jgi:hypothetical protein
MYLVEDRDQWRAVMNTVLNLRDSQTEGNFLTGCVTVPFSNIRNLLQGAA